MEYLNPTPEEIENEVAHEVAVQESLRTERVETAPERLYGLTRDEWEDYHSRSPCEAWQELLEVVFPNS